jgi:hypothetical protein
MSELISPQVAAPKARYLVALKLEVVGHINGTPRDG